MKRGEMALMLPCSESDWLGRLGSVSRTPENDLVQDEPPCSTEFTGETLVWQCQNH